MNLPRFVEAAGVMLMAIGIEDRSAMLAEMRAMGECIVTPANDRRVLGTINDFGRTLGIAVERHPLPEVALLLATIPCSPIGMEYPKDVARVLFARVVQNPPRATLRLVKN